MYYLQYNNTFNIIYVQYPSHIGACIRTWADHEKDVNDTKFLPGSSGNYFITASDDGRCFIYFTCVYISLYIVYIFYTYLFVFS